MDKAERHATTFVRDYLSRSVYLDLNGIDAKSIDRGSRNREWTIHICALEVGSDRSRPDGNFSNRDCGGAVVDEKVHSRSYSRYSVDIVRANLGGVNSFGNRVENVFPVDGESRTRNSRRRVPAARIERSCSHDIEIPVPVVKETGIQSASSEESKRI